MKKVLIKFKLLINYSILCVFLLQLFTACKKKDWLNNSEELIAVAQFDNTGKRHIFTLSPNGNNLKQLTFGLNEYWEPALSPKGNKIAYVSFSNIYIYVMNVDGNSVPQVLTSQGINTAPNWSPDGTQIAFAHMEPGGSSSELNIWLMNSDGTDKRALTSIADNNVPTWSPDGKKIAFHSNRNGGKYQIWTIDLNSSNLTQLTTSFVDSTNGYLIQQKVPAWSPDGKYISYWQGLEGSNNNSNTPWNVCVMEADGTNKKILDPGDDPTWSPDSQTIIHPSKMLCPNCLSMNGISPDGSNQRLIFVSNRGFGRMTWRKLH